MMWKNALKYPVLVIGILFFIIFMSSPNTKNYWKKIQRRYVPSTCDVTMDRVRPKAPKNWDFECPTTQLLIINIEHLKRKNNGLTLQQEMYRELANSLVLLGKHSNLETMPNLSAIQMNIHHPKLTIESSTDGKAIVEILAKKEAKGIARIINLTVKTKEILK